MLYLHLKATRMTTKDTKIINGHTHIRHYVKSISEREVLKRSEKFYKNMNARRSIRDFSDKPISREVIENILKNSRFSSIRCTQTTLGILCSRKSRD